MPDAARGLRSFLWRYYAYHFCNGFVLVYPVYAILFVRAGLSVASISVLLAIWSGSAVISELPSGALADRWHRPRMLVLSMVGKGAGFTCWLMAPSFATFALGFVCWGVAGSLRSGTLESLLFDTLQAHGATQEYERVAGRAMFYYLAAITAAFLLGAAVATYSFALTVWCSVAVMGIGAVLAAGFRDVRPTPAIPPTHGLMAQISGATRQAMVQPGLRRLMLFAMGALAVYGTLEEYDQLYRDWIGMPLAWFGVWSALLMGGEGLSARLAHRVGGRGRPRVKYACALAAGACLLAAALFPSFAVLPLYALTYWIMALAHVLVEGELQREIASAERATIISLHRLVMNLAGIGLALLFGACSRFGGLGPGLLLFAGLMLATGLAGLVRRR